LTNAQLIADTFNYLGVIDRIGNIVVLSSRIRYAKRQIQLQRLLRYPLARIDANPGFDPQCVDKNEIHGLSRLKSRPF